MRDLKLHIEIDALSPMSIAQVTSNEFVAVIVGARDVEFAAEWGSRILEWSLDRDISSSIVHHDD